MVALRPMLLLLLILAAVTSAAPTVAAEPLTEAGPNCTVADTGTWYGERWVCVAGMVIYTGSLCPAQLEFCDT